MIRTFEEDRNIEKRLYAYVNLFKLIITAESTPKKYEQFTLIGGNNYLNALIKDLNEKNISFYVEDDLKFISASKTIAELYYEMINIEKKLKSITHGSSTILKIALNDLQLIKMYINKDTNFDNLNNNIPGRGEILPTLEYYLPEEYIDILHQADGRIIPSEVTRKRK